MSGIDIGPKISIEGEKAFKDSLKAINSQIKASTSEIKALSAEYDKNNGAVQNLTQRQKALKDGVNAAQNKVKTLTAEYGRQNDKLKKLEEELRKAQDANGKNSDEALKAEEAYSRQARAVSDMETQINTARTQVASLTWDLEANAEELRNAESFARKYSDAMEAAGGKLEKIGGKISKVDGGLAMAVTTPITAAGIAAIKYASDAEESENKVEVAFKDSAQIVKDFAKTTVDTYGIASGAAMDMAALYGDMATAMGVPEDAAAEMSTKLVGLAGDLASFKNIDLDSAQTALKGIFTGETESLKNLGIVMTDTNLKAWAMEQGFLDAEKSEEELEKQQLALEKAQAAYNAAVEKGGEDSIAAREAKIKLQKAEEEYTSEATKSWEAVSQNEKVMLRYKYVMEQTKNAQGDYARTADGTANSMRTLQESGKELATSFGKILLPKVTPMIQKATGLIKSFDNLSDSQKQMIINGAAVAAASGPALKAIGTVTSGVGKLAKVFGTIGPVGTAATIALGIATGAGIAIWQNYNASVEADIAEHFGKITLSAEEVEDVAKRITTTDWTMSIDAVIDAKAKVEQAEKDITDATERINKLDWKVEIGLELTESEKEDYRAATEDLVKSTADYISQQGYTAELAIKATFGTESGTGAGLSAFASSFYASAQEELDELGKELADCVNASFEYNTLGENVRIDEIISKINGIKSKIAEAEQQASLDNMKIELSSSGLGIDADSFRRLNEKITEYSQQSLEASKEIRLSLLTDVNLEYQEMIDNGATTEFAEKVKADTVKEIEETFQAQQAEIPLTGLSFAFDSLPKNYKKQLDSSGAEIETYTEDFTDRMLESFVKTGTGAMVSYAELINPKDYAPQLSEDAKRTVSTMLKSLEPQKEALQNISDSCREAGVAVPESVKEGLSDIAKWEAAAGSASGMYNLLAEQLANDPTKLKFLMENAEFGKSIPEELAKAIETYTGYTLDAATGMWTKIEEGNALSAEEAAEQLNMHGKAMGEELASAIAEQYGLIYENGKYMVDKAAQGVTDNTPLFERQARAMANAGMQGAAEVTGGTTLPAPKVAPIDTSPITNAMSAVTSNVYTIFAKIKTLKSDNMDMFAEGGFTAGPSIAGEDGPEAIIPLSPSRRQRAMELMARTAEILDMQSYESVVSASYAMHDMSRKAAATVEKRTEYRVEKGAVSVEIHTRGEDPEAIAAAVEDRVYTSMKRKLVGHGR